MRQVGAFNEELKAIEFVHLLDSHNISATIDEDQGEFTIWVHDEGHISRAKKLFEEFEAGKRPFFKKKKEPLKCDLPQDEPEKASPFHQGDEVQDELKKKKQPPPSFTYQPYVTRALLIVCALVYIISLLQTLSKDRLEAGRGFYPPIARDLFMDYPRSMEIRDELIKEYGADKIQQQNLPEEAQGMLKEFNDHPPWIGVYNIMVSPKESRPYLWKATFLEKVREGQIWRLFTPVVLHIGLLHFVFNMLWLVILGKMVEFNMGRVRFILFILITGLISNFCQYVMTGPFFLGISGVLAGFIGYILIRKKIAPWEVYFIRKETLYFFLTFIFGFLVLQIISFALLYFQIYEIPVPIANTGHISGLITGMILAKTNLMSKKLS